MSSPVSFQPAGPAELPLIVELSQHLYAHEQLAFDPARVQQAVSVLFHAPYLGSAWLIEQAGQSIGYLILTFGYSVEFGGPFGLLDELFVNEACRGRGIGTQAIHFALDQCRARQIKTLRLEVTHANQDALRLYRSSGFEVLERSILSRRVTD